VAVPNDIAHWRAQIFARLLLVVFVLGLATAIPSILLATAEGLWSIAVIDTVALVWVFAIWRLRKADYSLRVINFLVVAFLVGCALMLKVGPVSQIYLVAIPILAALLLGLRTALWSLAATGLAVLVLGYVASEKLRMDGMPDTAFLRAVIVTINFLFMTAVLTLSSAVLLRHLERSVEELRLTSAAVARLNDMVLIAEATDGSQRIIFVNEAFERRTGYRRHEVLGRNLRLLHGPQTEESEIARIERAMARSEAVQAELVNYTKAGEPYWVETDMVPFNDEGGNNTHWVVVERDITERKKSQDDIHRLAFFDVLTGLPNRRLLMDRIDKLLASSERGATFSAVMFIDLDRFKYINDARGHAIGDALLRHAAGRLAQLMRKADTVARIGGDEFVVLLAHLATDLPNATHAALTVAEKIRDAISQGFEIEGQSYQSSASIGITLLPKNASASAPQTAQDLLREADTAMYRAKSEGRNGVAFFESAMQAEVERRLSLERDLGAALAQQRLQMYLQPQVDAAGRTVGAELLMRWPLDNGSMVPPSVFIPVAEESGLILPLGRWALQQACAAALQLSAVGCHVPLSVNVSPSQFRQHDFVGQVRDILATSGVPPQRLILEVTEGLLIDKLEDTIARMAQLHALGIRFSVDAVGTGYSSLAYLKKMPLYELKIDRSFVMDTPDDANSKALVQSILAMAGHLGLRVVAEGVETRAQADFLSANQCACMQGYLFAHPMPLASMLEYVKKEAAHAA